MSAESVAAQALRTALPTLLRDLRDYAPRGSLAVLALMLLAAALEGVGLVTLVPLLGAVGIATTHASGGAGGGLLGWAASLSGALGLTGVLLLYVLLLAVQVLVSWARDSASAGLHQGFVDHLRLRLYRAVAAADWPFLARTHSAELAHALNTDLGRISQAVNTLLQGCATAAVSAIYLAVAFALSPPLTLLTVATGALLLALLRRHEGDVSGAGRRLGQSTGRLQAETAEFLAGLRLIKSGNLEAAAAARYRGRLQAARREIVAFVRQQALSRGLLKLAGAVALALLTGLALTRLAVPPASVLVLVFLFSRLFPFLSGLQQGSQRLRYHLPAYADFRAMHARCLAAAEPVAGGPPPVLRAAIRLHGVRYTPPGSGDELLRGIDLEIPCRRTIALVGASGAGKSTLADLVGGLLAPSAGVMEVDGRPLTDLRGWREGVAYVAQDGFLLHASVRDNLLWTQPDATEAAMWEALGQAAAADFVRALPQGLDTLLGERGLRLSGGERQRIAIARALLRRPQLLILDEATSALDREHERRVHQAISRLHGQLTILVIAHRLDTVRDADRVYVIDAGQVRDSGTFAELQQRGLLGREPGDHDAA